MMYSVEALPLAFMTSHSSSNRFFVDVLTATSGITFAVVAERRTLKTERWLGLHQWSQWLARVFCNTVQVS